MSKISIRELDLKGRSVFMRVDFNVPLDEAGAITDDTRIRASMPSIQYALERGARLILASHLGRPKGKPNPKMSLRPVATRLSELLGKPVKFVADCVGPEAQSAAAALQDGGVLLLENLRFHPEEEKNDPNFARQLAKLANLFVMDAFGSAHRAHASTEAIAHLLQPAAAGLLMEKELEYLGKAVENPAHPYFAIVGGAKVSDKIDLLKNFVKQTDTILVGGAMAYTFLKAQGHHVGRSKVEDDRLDLARELLEAARTRGTVFQLPQDHIVTAELNPAAEAEVVSCVDIPPDRLGADIGPATRAEWAKTIKGAKTIVWNGPMGVFEIPQFAEGTLAVAKAVADSGALSVVGGGDTIAAVRKAGVAGRISHISTGGGASLEFLSGLKLPGVEALTDKPEPVTSGQQSRARAEG
jgi:phosphoglycerate kinase